MLEVQNIALWYQRIMLEVQKDVWTVRKNVTISSGWIRWTIKRKIGSRRNRVTIISTDDDTSVLIAVLWTKIFNRKHQNAIWYFGTKCLTWAESFGQGGQCLQKLLELPVFRFTRTKKKVFTAAETGCLYSYHIVQCKVVLVQHISWPQFEPDHINNK
jgi:hypothetical protein